MSGTILIVDAVVTNRIILKVKLRAAHFKVTQATSAADALRLATRTVPDLIIAGTGLPDADTATFIARLRALPDLAAIPVVMLLNDAAPLSAAAALAAGADDVVVQPLDETFLMARIRSLLRQHHTLQDLRQNAGQDSVAGFAEAQGSFASRGKVAIVAADTTDAMAMRTQLAGQSAHQVSLLSNRQPLTAPTGARVPDIFLILAAPDSPDTTFQVMAELRASPATRHSLIMGVVPDTATGLAATLLDMGAADVMAGPRDTRELALRLDNQLRRKQLLDHIRGRIRDGLRAATIDPLTGLHNRRFALPFLQRLIETPEARHRPFAVMLADLDHFKRINDSFGHPAGDAVLRHVAARLRENLREADMIARIGGEEFLIVLPDTPSDEARQTADRLCRIVGDAAIALTGGAGPARVTISIGVTLIRDYTACEPVTLDGILQDADRALYGAKARGRNTVTYSAVSAA